MKNSYLYSELTDSIIKVFYLIYNHLGYGFLEKVYENAMAIELLNSGLFIKTQQPVKIKYNGKEIGFYITDIIVNNCVIIEIKAAESLCEEHEAQLLNYLKATDIEVGLLLNFGKKPQIKRKVFSKEYKPVAIKNHEES